MAVPPPAFMTDKCVLRARLRTRRDAFVADRRPEPPPPPPEFLRRLRPALIVASYLPIGSEADPAAWEAAARAAGSRLALPHVVDRATPLRFLLWAESAALEVGPFGLRNPPSGAQEVAPDMIVTPLLGFDPALNRLGQGAGHYDRAFAAYPDAWRIGLAWSVQQVPALPADPWDVPLHGIATEHRWWAA